MVRFRMFKLSVEQFAILGDVIPEGAINLQTSFSFLYSIEANRIAIPITYKFLDKDNNPLLLLVLQTEYEILKEDWENCRKDDLVILPKSLLECLIAQNIGAARGVVFCKTENTPFAGLIIPPINVTEMKIEDLILEKK